MLDISPTHRFSSRVENYARFRPSYPTEVIDILKQECGLVPSSVVADIGSGTGIFARLLLENGNPVFGVEPNERMRRAAQDYLSIYPSFTSVSGTAENTSLQGYSIDLVTAAQAAHWFDRDKAIAEFRRILKPGGYVVLIWNDRRIDATEFDREYEQLLDKYGTDYAEVKRRDKAAAEFLVRCEKRVLRNFQDFDLESLKGRLLSSSYTPQAGHPSHAPMLGELERIFGAHQKSGVVRMEYATRIYFSQLT